MSLTIYCGTMKVFAAVFSAVAAVSDAWGCGCASSCYTSPVVSTYVAPAPVVTYIFTKIKSAIDDMITQLGKEKEDEIKHKDFCIDEFNNKSA